jgi:glyoxylase-like metal-dependent hydrolase (beta-lactamase superfamily II)
VVGNPGRDSINALVDYATPFSPGALAVALASALLHAQAPQATQATASREIHNSHFGTFVITTDGIILIDPISTDAGRWLKGELATRFPGRAVKVIVYSHHDGDHSGGAEAFADTTPEIVAHENAPRGITDIPA